MTFRAVCVFVLALIVCSSLGCDDAATPSQATAPALADETAGMPADGGADGFSSGGRLGGSPRSGGGEELSAADLMAFEQFWPNIVALTETIAPSAGGAPLKRGYRGAMIRLTPEGLVRIDFGRHGRHDVPLASTDLLERVHAVRTGELHKVAPNFLAHFGTQFLDPTTPEPVPFPTPELAKSRLFLCLFLSPSDPGFAPLAERLAALLSAPRLQMLLFPLGLGLEQVEAVKPALQAAHLLVPFAYPAAADQHARSLLGGVPAGPRGLLISPEGRVVLEVDLDAAAAPEAIEALRSAIETSPAGPSPASLAPAITESS